MLDASASAQDEMLIASSSSELSEHTTPPCMYVRMRVCAAHRATERSPAAMLINSCV